jgi:hypothetical protein
MNTKNLFAFTKVKLKHFNTNYSAIILKNINHILKPKRKNTNYSFYHRYYYNRKNVTTTNTKGTICIVKAKYYFNNLYNHISYITRDGVGENGEKPELFSTTDMLYEKGIQYRFIISPKIIFNKNDLEEITKLTIHRLSMILNNDKQEYTFLYSYHYNTEHPHIHLICNIKNKKYRFNDILMKRMLRKNIEKYIYSRNPGLVRERTNDTTNTTNIDNLDILLRNDLVVLHNNKYIYTEKYKLFNSYIKKYSNFINMLDKYKNIHIINKNDTVSGTIVEYGRIDEYDNINYFILKDKQNRYFYIPYKGVFKYNNDMYITINKKDTSPYIKNNNISNINR